jgi:uncharacterized membrane protein (DUF485 family)
MNSPADKKTPVNHDDSPELSAMQARSGLWLFAVYCLAYAIFMVLATFSHQTMALPTPLGPNVAIVYGFGLIFGAIVVALAYMLACKWNVDTFQNKQ